MTMTRVRTLIVDDDPHVCRLHARYVAEQPGFVVQGVAHSGAAAVDAVSRLPIDLVLLDIHLPEYSGLEVLHRLHAAADRAVDVIVISSARDRTTVRQALAAQAVDYLVKPFTKEVLADRLSLYLARRVPAVERRNDPYVNDDAFAQSEIDALLSHGPDNSRPRAPSITGGPHDTRLPKGLSAPTMDLIVGALRTGPASAVQVAAATGTSRATARRYLDYLHQHGTVDIAHRYGHRGRPELLYRLAPASWRFGD